ncbi:PUB3, partial [Symbiodinium sp. CCMP2456]
LVRPEGGGHRGDPSPSASALPALPLPPVAAAGPPPKSFDAWGPLVKAYNDKLLDGKPRSFPTRRLAGADAVLARIYHEHTVSKSYTPLLLGEILAARTWTSGDELNRLAVPQKEAGSLHIVGGSLVAADDKRAWEPRGVMSVLDGLEAVRLAWILTTVGDEGDVNDYIAWWDRKVRARTAHVENIVFFWTSTATTLAMELRQRRTFKEVTADIMADTSSWLEAMATPPPLPEPKKPARPQPPPKAEPDQGADWVPKHRFGFLYENVDMDQAAAKVPRLWWTSVDWTRFQVDPDDGAPLEWAKKGRWERLRLASARPSADTFDLVSTLPSRQVGALTPAPTDEGRPKPRATRGKTSKDTDARWSDGKRQYAPWHYQLEAMLQDSQGVLHLPTAEIKEQLHGIPTGYTAQAGADDRTRHRMIGNGWHWGVAGRILGFVVLAAWAAALAEAGRLPSSPKTSTLQWLTQACSWDFSPPPRPSPPVLGEGLDMEQHWASAPLMQHSLARRPALEPALSAVIEFRRQWRHDLCRIRREVIAELLVLVEEREDDTRAWLQELPAHVRATYTTSDRPRPFQGPTFLGLLRDLGDRGESALRRGQVFQGRSGVHTAALLEELVQEARLGRVRPCAAPDHWSVATSALPWTADMRTLRQPPLGDCFAALSFAICQVDENGDLKLRR